MCPVITDHYQELVGLSIARGFTHEVRQRFGGPNGCTHTTALLLAMGPVAVQSRGRCARRRGGTDAAGHAGDPREQVAERNLDTCHVWAADGEQIAAIRAGGRVEVPLTIRRRLDAVGIPVDLVGQVTLPGRRSTTTRSDSTSASRTCVCRPGTKWASVGGRLAAWIADMDFPVAPAITARLVDLAARDVGYPRWPSIGRSALPEQFAARMAERFGVGRRRAGAAARAGRRDAGRGADDPPPHRSRATGSSCTCRRTRRSCRRSSAPGGASSEIPARRSRRPLDVRPRRARRPPRSPSGRRCCCCATRTTRRATSSSGPSWRSSPRSPPGTGWWWSATRSTPSSCTRPTATCRSPSLGADVAARTVTVTSSSKAFNLAGLRWAILHAGARRAPRRLVGAPAALPRRAERDGGGGHRGGVDRTVTGG